MTLVRCLLDPPVKPEGGVLGKCADSAAASGITSGPSGQAGGIRRWGELPIKPRVGGVLAPAVAFQVPYPRT